MAATIAATIAKAPQWIGHDLGSKDFLLRIRAGESLAATIAAALAKGLSEISGMAAMEKDEPTGRAIWLSAWSSFCRDGTSRQSGFGAAQENSPFLITDAVSEDWGKFWLKDRSLWG